MDTTWQEALGHRFAAAIDQLEDALRRCPDERWQERMWVVTPDDPGVALDEAALQVYSEFWYIAYHAIFFLDLYLSGGLEQLDAGFAAPAPFLAEEHAAAVLPARVYTRAELEAYIAHCRRKSEATISALTEADWRRPCRWGRGETSFAELLLVNLGHVREHGAQLGMFLGQRG